MDVNRVEYEDLSDDRLAEPSATIRGRVEAARERQWARFAGLEKRKKAPHRHQVDAGLCRLRKWPRIGVQDGTGDVAIDL